MSDAGPPQVARAPLGRSAIHEKTSVGADNISWAYPRWIAHRGAGTFAPENTMAAFRLGASHGYRMFECDTKLAADGLPFLMHDATLARTTNAREVFGPAASDVAGDHPWSELAKLDAGHWHSPGYAGEPPATLEGISRYCLANGYFLNIEIKPTRGVEHCTGAVVGRHADRLWNNAPTPPLLTSFEPEALEGARSTASHLPRGLLLDALGEGWLEQAIALDCIAVVCDHPLLDAATVAKVHGAGMKCLSFTVNDEWVAQRLLQLRIDGIITDRVDLFQPS